jgi:hypothetical protein
VGGEGIREKSLPIPGDEIEIDVGVGEEESSVDVVEQTVLDVIRVY